MSRLKLFIPLIVFLVLGLLFYRGLGLNPAHVPSALIDKPLPPFSLPSLKDPERILTPEDLKGRVSLVNIWATWCVSCRVEHPYLVKLAEEGTAIYGVNYKDDVEEAQRWLEKLHDPYLFSVVDADGRLGLDLGVSGAPETYVVDRKGTIRYKHVGVVDEKVWLEKIKPIVDKYR